MELVELVLLLAAVGGSTFVVGMAAWLWHRIKRLEDAALGHSDAPMAVLTEIEELRDALNAGDREVERMSERLDFLERLLISGEEGESDKRRLASGIEVEGGDGRGAR
jgi:hypothetical protein